MRDKISKAIKVSLACALVFLVAAPLIVGVYDAARGIIRMETEELFRKVVLQAVTGSARSVFDNVDNGPVLDSFGEIQREDTQLYEGRLPEEFQPEYSEVDGVDLRSTGNGIYQGAGARFEWSTSAGLDDNEDTGISRYFDEGEQAEEIPTVDDWYSGDSCAADLLGSGDVHLVYESKMVR